MRLRSGGEPLQVNTPGLYQQVGPLFRFTRDPLFIESGGAGGFGSGGTGGELKALNSSAPISL